MIKLTAEIEIKSTNDNPFRVGESQLGGLLFGNEIETIQKIDNRNILSCESSIEDVADEKTFSVGLNSSGGRISFSDPNLRFLHYANNRILKGNEKTTIFIENTISKTREKVGEYFASNWNYNNDNRIVDVSIYDGLEELQEIEFDGFYLNYDTMSNRNIGYIYNELQKAVPTKYKMQGIDKIDTNTQKMMYNTYINVPFLEAGNFWSQFNKISNLCLLRMYKTKDGETTVKYNGGN